MSNKKLVFTPSHAQTELWRMSENNTWSADALPSALRRQVISRNYV